MKGLKKVALASAIAAVSAGAQAELKALDDSQMGELTGQAGLTIDVETKWSIGEFQYKDAGSLLITGISMGGNANDEALTGVANGGYLDNIRMTIDIAGDGTAAAETTSVLIDSSGTTFGVNLADNSFNYGFSEIKGLATVHARAQIAAGTPDAGMLNAALLGQDANTGLAADGRKTYGDGDLVIHWGFTDAWQKAGGFAAVANGGGSYDGNAVTLDGTSYAVARDIATRSVDFNFAIDAIGLASSSYVTGSNATDAGWVADNSLGPVYEQISESFLDGIDSDTTDTVLISGLDIKGYYGPADLHIENDGNGFGDDGSGLDINGDGTADVPGTGNADSKITWGSYFRITDLDVYIDIAGLLLEDVEIHNDRGDLSGIDGTSSFGFAHSIRNIYAVKDTVLSLENAAQGGSTYVDGLALNTRFKGDLDIGALKFGNTDKSIGSIYLTDIESDTRWTISAH